MKKVTFGSTLRGILDRYDLTYSSLAKALCYDESYISKWINGRAVPSSSNLNKILDGIIHLICEASLVDIYPLSDEMLTVRMDLEKSYRADILIRKQMDKSEKINSQVTYLAIANVYYVAKKMRSELLYSEAELNVVEIIDLFSINRDSRMLIAGIENGIFAICASKEMRKVSMIVDFSQITDYVYDAIFLIHMLTSFSRIEFEIYSDEYARGRIISITKNGKSVVANIFNELEAIGIVENEDPCQSQLLYEKVSYLCKQESLVVKKILYDEWIEDIYIQSLFSDDLKWLVGHFIECFVPQRLSENIIKKLSENNPQKYVDCLSKINSVRINIYKTKELEVIIYRTALLNFIINGELDFYNNKIMLTIKERVLCIDYILELMKTTKIQFKLLNEDLSKDFEYITNPNIFLSDRSCYLRLENGMYNNNLLMVKDRTVWNVFIQFYNEIWSERQGNVLSKTTMIEKQLVDCLEQLDLMKNY